MESEKVKEIKKALKYNIKLGLSYEDDKKPCKVWLAEILTLINELESENDRLKNKNYQLEQDLGQCENGYKLELHTARYQLNSANEDLRKAEDRIAELEQKNEILQGTKDRLTFADRIELVNNAVETKLKQFAERLKENLEENSPIVGYDLEDLEFDGETIQECIDETLKEFIKN